MEDPRPPDRRIGQRKPLTPLKIEWRAPDPAKKRKWKAPATQTGWVVDVSVTGAAIEAPRADDLFQGQKVRVALGDLTGVVIIRRAVPSTVERMAHYGVEFIDLDPGLADILRSMLESDRPEGLEEFWQRAR
jgi:hypothetical protein